MQKTKLIDCSQNDIDDFIKSSQLPNKLPRFGKLSAYWFFYNGSQYSEYKYDWDGIGIKPGMSIGEYETAVIHGPTIGAGPLAGMYVPLRARKPNIKDNIAKEVVNGFTSYIFGHRKFPKLDVKTDDPDLKEQVLAYYEDLIKKSRLHLKAILARTYCGSMGSVVLVLNYTGATPIIDVYDARFCVPLWADKRNAILAAIEIRYPLKTEEIIITDDGNKTAPQTMKYNQTIWERRVITMTSDTLYQSRIDRDAKAEVENPKWIIQGEPIKFDYGFVPALWIQNGIERETMDGVSDYAGEMDDIDEVNRLGSAADKSIFANMDPTLVVGLSPEDLRKQQGQGIRKGNGIAITVGEQGSASYLEIKGDGIRLGLDRANDIRSRIYKICHYVPLDAEKMQALTAQSGVSMKTLLSEMFSKLDIDRVIWGEVILNILDMFATMQSKGQTVTSKVVKVFKRIFGQLEDVQKLPAPQGDYTIDLVWGDYIEPTRTEQKEVVDMATELTGGGSAIIDDQTAVELVSKVLPVNPDQVRKNKEDQEKNRQDKIKMGME